MGRAPCCDKANVKKGPWSPEEDAKLKEYIDKCGTGGNWIALPQKAGLKRCGKSCRLRWLNYLRPNIKHGEFSDEEDRIICTLYATMGSRWSIIASQLPGRTDNDIKNYWNTKLKKKLMMAGHGKFPQPYFHQTPIIPHHQSQSTLSSLSNLYNSYFSQSTKSLTTASSAVVDSISAPQSNFIYCNSNPNFTTTTQQYPYYHNQQNHRVHEGSVDLQYNFPVKDNINNTNMLMFGVGNEASCSSSDGSCSHINYGCKNHIMKQEQIECLEGFISNHDHENQKFMLHYNGKVNADPFSAFLDIKQAAVLLNGGIVSHVESSTHELHYSDVEQVINKQLVSTSNGNLLYNDHENKTTTTHERGMYYY